MSIPAYEIMELLPQGNACGSSGTADKGEGRGDGFPVPFKPRVGRTDPNRLDSRAQAQFHKTAD